MAVLKVQIACSANLGVMDLRRLTTRLNGPGMLRQKQEEIEIRVPGKGCEGAVPGRSARSR